ncbi:uncharacterized protein LOC114241063 [Bombyx mandarina]|uniref:Uncharacterized protein LOC114241063 n=1 Tax=Bombyx mandarina TaxID=7092 RepID=A0A6J2JET6_BOMMA|nr:uncharacterized protein LOC114241063 [Bombyx mandarina]
MENSEKENKITETPMEDKNNEEPDWPHIPKFKKHKGRLVSEMRELMYGYAQHRRMDIYKRLLQVELCRNIALIHEENGYDCMDVENRPRGCAVFKHAYRERYPAANDHLIFQKINRTIRDSMWPNRLGFSYTLRDILRSVNPNQMQQYRQIDYSDTVFTPQQIRDMDTGPL